MNPTITCPPNITTCTPTVTYSTPVGTDNCSGVVTTQIAGLPSGSSFPVGVTTNTFLATDVAGNTASCSFTVTVNPTPVVNNPGNQGPLCHNAATAAITFTTPTTGAGTVTYTWVNNTPGIGLAASGTGDIASFNVNNNSTVNPLTAIITVIPLYFQ
ncbi:MAG: HYR domain-containing protein [Chitinophagaceae bacterium]|nr:HYR domain-containing protein [Chitinophagaceae bacterium]